MLLVGTIALAMLGPLSAASPFGMNIDSQTRSCNSRAWVAEAQRRQTCVIRAGLSRIALLYLVGKVQGSHERECE
jgi:hypothetical protein